MKNGFTFKKTLFMLFIIVTPLSINAQSNDGDRFIINENYSNQWARLQMNTDTHVFTWSNIKNYMGLSYDYLPPRGGGQGLAYKPVFRIYQNGSTQAGNAYIGLTVHGPYYAGFSHKDRAEDLNGYAFLQSSDGEYTLINKKNTGSGYIAFRVGNQNKMVLTDSGRLGIGTYNPKQTFHVTGDSYMRGHVYLYASNGDGQDGTAYIQARDDSGNSDIGLQLRTQDDGEITNAVYISPQGDVDIANMLNATGGIQTNNIQANKVTLNIGSFPDYVFADDYSLMSIEEVAQYITNNKHLPNMPSEKEMVANGMDVSKLSIKMVEKIEELTLYTIQQEKQLKSQEQLIKALMRRIDRIENKNTKQ